MVLIKIPDQLTDALLASRDAVEDTVQRDADGGHVTWMKGCQQSALVKPEQTKHSLKRKRADGSASSAARQYGVANAPAIHFVEHKTVGATSASLVYDNPDGVRTAFQVGGEIARSVTPAPEIAHTTPTAAEFLKFNLATLKKYGSSLGGPTNTPAAFPTTPIQLAHLSLDAMSLAYNHDNHERKVLNKSGLHVDGTVFLSAVVCAKGPREQGSPPLGVCQRFGTSAEAGALFIEVGCSVFGYRDRDLLLFVGSWLHTSVSTGRGHKVVQKKAGAHGRLNPRPDRSSFVCFLRRPWGVHVPQPSALRTAELPWKSVLALKKGDRVTVCEGGEQWPGVVAAPQTQALEERVKVWDDFANLEGTDVETRQACILTHYNYVKRKEYGVSKRFSK